MRFLLLWVDLLPLRAASWLVARLSDVVFAFGGQRRTVAIDNILQAGIASDSASAVRLARSSARHFLVSIVETLKARRLLSGDRWRHHVVFRIPAAVRAALEDPHSGLLLAGGHLGNWEIGAQALSRFKPVTAAARRVSNPWVDRLLQRRKPSERFSLVPEWFGGPARYSDALKAGGAVAMLIDLDARGEGIKFDFFGRPAATHVTVPMLHLVTKAPLTFVTCRRQGSGRFEIELSELIEQRPTGDKDADVQSILARLNAELETAVRATPEQYLWAHSRWKYGAWQPPPGFVPLSGRLAAHGRGPAGR